MPGVIRPALGVKTCHARAGPVSWAVLLQHYHAIFATAMARLRGSRATARRRTGGCREPILHPQCRAYALCWWLWRRPLSARGVHRPRPYGLGRSGPVAEFLRRNAAYRRDDAQTRPPLRRVRCWITGFNQGTFAGASISISWRSKNATSASRCWMRPGTRSTASSNHNSQ